MERAGDDVAQVTLRYFAAAREAAGTPTSTVEAESLRSLLETVSAGNAELSRVLAICSFLVNGDRPDPDAPLPDGAVVDALPPFAGG